MRNGIGVLIVALIAGPALGQRPAPDQPSDLPPRPGPSRPESAGGFGGGLGNGSGGPGYAASWNPARAVSGQGTDFEVVRQNLSVGAPVWRDGGDSLALLLGVRNTHVSTGAILPDTRRAFPSDLWNVSLGAGYSHRFANGWTGGVMVGVGSASDKPFDTLAEANVTLNAGLRIPARNERDLWTLGLTYSPAGLLNFPVPLVSYFWRPSERFQMSIGLPLALTWRPDDDWVVTASYVPLTNVSGRVTYRAAEAVFVYGGYEFLNESYFLAGRADRRDRFQGFEQRVVGGLRWEATRHAALEVSSGYAFGRYFAEGRNQGGATRDRVDIAPGPFLGVALRAKF